jgi:CRP-like cAMP-binding protein
MTHFLMNQQSRVLAPRETLPEEDMHSLWRLESGTLRIDSLESGESSDFVRLALPGDLLGVESLAGVPERLLVRAITPVRLVSVAFRDKEQLTQLLMNAILKGHQRCREVVSLRTGSATVRIKRLLQLLSRGDDCRLGEHKACALPTLNDMAAIVNAAPETVCRVLTSLRELEILQDRSPPSAKFHRLELREHRVRPGAPARAPTLRSRMLSA